MGKRFISAYDSGWGVRNGRRGTSAGVWGRDLGDHIFNYECGAESVEWTWAKPMGDPKDGLLSARFCHLNGPSRPQAVPTRSEVFTYMTPRGTFIIQIITVYIRFSHHRCEKPKLETTKDFDLISYLFPTYPVNKSC